MAHETVIGDIYCMLQGSIREAHTHVTQITEDNL